GPLDAKLLRGGLVDLEFIVHFLQLHDGVGLTPSLPDALAALSEAGLLPAAMVDAHDRLTRLLVAARLLAPDTAIPPPGPRAALALACGYDDWDCLLAGFAEARTSVAAVWAETFGETLEIDQP
ncbi:MAG: glutamine-synthetase adenylyltransferase, partial [Novosphingobium sp.]